MVTMYTVRWTLGVVMAVATVEFFVLVIWTMARSRNGCSGQVRESEKKEAVE